MFIALPALAFVALLWGGAAEAQTITTPEPVDPGVTQEERICDMEIAEVEEAMANYAEDFDQMEQARMRTQLDEARQFCDDGNEVMAAIRLEALTAMLEVARPID